jgi:hypothetical protein
MPFWVTKKFNCHLTYPHHRILRLPFDTPTPSNGDRNFSVTQEGKWGNNFPPPPPLRQSKNFSCHPWWKCEDGNWTDLVTI